MGTKVTKVYTYKVFTHKELLKHYKEYLELHKRCVKTYLVGKSLEYSSIKKFFVIYDRFIDEENILPYFFLPINYFVNSLILYKLHNIKFYGKYSKSKIKG